MNNRLGFILFSFAFILFFLILDLDKRCDVMSHKSQSMIHVKVTVTQLCDIEKNIKDSKTDNVIQYGNNMLV